MLPLRQRFTEVIVRLCRSSYSFERLIPNRRVISGILSHSGRAALDCGFCAVSIGDSAQLELGDVFTALLR
jgi:hypothetical protein